MSTSTPSPISEDMLHAFIDGQLSDTDMDRVKAYLDANPALAREVEGWREIDGALKQGLSPHFNASARDIPGRAGSRQKGWAWRGAVAGAVIGAFGLGGAMGYLVHPVLNPAAPSHDTQAVTLAAQARDIHLTYAREVRHPVEVGANEREHLVNWLGNRIETEFTAPRLEALGYDLVGGRLLPIGGAPGAMLMYENAQGDRATILLARNAGDRDTAFQFSSGQGVNSFRWVDGPLAYAISGFIDRPALEELSRAVYAHFENG